jgi:hypothetical protein
VRGKTGKRWRSRAVFCDWSDRMDLQAFDMDMQMITGKSCEEMMAAKDANGNTIPGQERSREALVEDLKELVYGAPYKMILKSRGETWEENQHPETLFSLLFVAINKNHPKTTKTRKTAVTTKGIARPRTNIVSVQKVNFVERAREMTKDIDAWLK